MIQQLQLMMEYRVYFLRLSESKKDCLTAASDGLSQAKEIYYCVAHTPKHQIPCTNLTDETVYKKYHVKVNSCNERHNDAAEANKKEMTAALVKNLGTHPNREVTQHQIEILQSEVKSMPESGRRDFDGYLTQVAKARVDLLKSIAKCNRMHMLRKKCTTDSVSNNKRTFGDVEEEERSPTESEIKKEIEIEFAN